MIADARPCHKCLHANQNTREAEPNSGKGTSMTSTTIAFERSRRTSFQFGFRVTGRRRYALNHKSAGSVAPVDALVIGDH